MSRSTDEVGRTGRRDRAREKFLAALREARRVLNDGGTREKTKTSGQED